MPVTPDLPTWRIMPLPGGHFRWAVAGNDHASRPGQLRETLAPKAEDRAEPRFQSMEDLLHQVPAELLDCGGAPRFRTGSGRAVSLKQSSIRKARSVLECGDSTYAGPILAAEVCDGPGEGSLSMFRSASGKSVTLREPSIRKASTFLEGDTVEKGPVLAAKVCDGSGEGSLSMFRSGSGKSVTLRERSIRKATTLLEGGTVEKGSVLVAEGGSSSAGGGFSLFQTGTGKSVTLRESSIRKAAAVLEGEVLEKGQMQKYTMDGYKSFSNSLFQTGSGKTVNISSAGLLRATTLLGLDTLEGKNNLSTSKYFENPMNKSNTNRRKTCEISNHMAKESMNHEISKASFDELMDVSSSVQRNSHTCPRDFHSLDNHPLVSESHVDPVQPPIKFHTAGGRSVSISSDALKRARNLLGESDVGVLHNDVKAYQNSTSIHNKTYCDKVAWNKENLSFDCENAGSFKNMKSFSRTAQPSLRDLSTQCLMLNQVNTNDLRSETIHQSNTNTPHMLKPSINNFYVSNSTIDRLAMIPEDRQSAGPLVDISNNLHSDSANIYQLSSEKKRLRRTSTISPFKRPRNSRFTTPSNNSILLLAAGSSVLSTSENSCPKARVSTRYPFISKRKSVKDFFGAPPSHHELLGHLPNDVKHINADNADKYRFHDTSAFGGIGPEAFQDMLLLAGASFSHTTKEWVANHYKWIVWKLASFERGYPAQADGKYLTISNVLEELKYRYEKEYNFGQRSAVKRILDGDASPASTIVLCVSAIRTFSKQKNGTMDKETYMYEDSKKLSSSTQVDIYHPGKVELTDGWYSVGALLDVSLSKQLSAGKLFVGQKLRICGASLCGWVGPVSPLEASDTVNLLLHINGTYRAHWADSLGFCKVHGAPLSFRCIKGAGGIVPRTLVGVTRIYPILYKERVVDGGSIVRTERMEQKALQLYNQRRACIAEDIVSEQQDTFLTGKDNDEGAKLFKILENAAEPEMIMADMSSEQLKSFSTYQAKQEVIRQSDMQKKIEKALEDAHLISREVTPFMRVRVVGLTRKGPCRKGRPREGLITIWNPTEKQKVDLVEGQIYVVAGLMPLNSGVDIIYLQARGPSTVWKSLFPTETEKIEPFFIHRRSVPLSSLGEIPLASEFDLAAVIVHVGEVYIYGRQKKQWIFMTDGSKCISSVHLGIPQYSLLAVSFCSPMIDDDSSPILGQCLTGTTVGFCNLVKGTRDQLNNIWVAEATENSSYSLCHNLPFNSHLKEAASSANKWAKESCSTIQILRERALCIIGGDGS